MGEGAGVKYKIVSKLDITKRVKGCTESPVITLLRSLRELGEGEGLLLKLDNERFPAKGVEVLVKKKGFEFELLSEENGLVSCVVYKPLGDQ